MMGKFTALLFLMLAQKPGGNEDALLSALRSEVDREYSVLKEGTPPVYYLAYRVEDEESLSLDATLGGVSSDNENRSRHIDITLRVGSPALDNTHEMKGTGLFDFSSMSFPELLPIADDEALIRRELWRITHVELGKAIERYNKVTANESVMASSQDSSADYTIAPAVKDVQPVAAFQVDRQRWAGVIEKAGAVFREFPAILSSSVSFSAERNIKYYVDSSGSAIRHSGAIFRARIHAETQSIDGMPLFLDDSFSGFSEKDLPEDAQLVLSARNLAGKLLKLKDAPAAEPYTGPAIFLNKAAGVFFHEVLGHRLEGHRQKSEKEGQTFTQKVGEQLLPLFLDVEDDPTLDRFQGKPLIGRYPYDDEGVKSEKVALVEKGVLKGFLMSRSPIKGFPGSNGHGRGSLGRKPVARQANLLVKAQKTVPFSVLKEELVAECKKQGKPYGLVFADISGGFTATGRFFPQAFKVVPIEVYKVFADGRPDEIVRGVDIVGTPLASLEKIIAASDDYEVFNGFCGAESGYIPVAVAAPSILVEQIEVEKKSKDMKKPPVLPSPLHGGGR